MKTLGLDIGTNSIGWAIVEGYWNRNPENNNFYFHSNFHSDFYSPLLKAGVHTFPMSLNDENQNITKATDRRKKRGARRLYDRRRRRKINLLRVLSQNNMCPPISKEELEEWRYKKIFPINNSDLINWLKQDKQTAETANPYYLRYKAIQEKVSLYELGRALYHLSQRRGFLSNKKTSKNNKENSVIYKAMARIEAEKQEQKFQTIGECFYHRYNEVLTRPQDSNFAVYHKKIRNRGYKPVDKKTIKFKNGEEVFGENLESIHLHRKKDYEEEFKLICTTQKLNEELTNKLYHAIYFQRPLKSQKHTVGKCTLEPTKTRSPKSNPIFELFRMRQLVNNLRISINEEVSRPLSDEEVLNIEKVFLNVTDSKIESLQKNLQKKHPNDSIMLNYKEDTKVNSCTTLARLKSVFITNGNAINTFQELFSAIKASFLLSEEKTVDILIQELWHVLYFSDFQAEKTEEEIELYLQEWLKKRFNVTQEQADKFSKITLEEGYAKLSIQAMKNILLYMEMGIGYSESVFLANLEKIFGSNWKKNKDRIIDLVLKEIHTYKVYSIEIDFINDFVAKLKKGEISSYENNVEELSCKLDAEQKDYFEKVAIQKIKAECNSAKALAVEGNQALIFFKKKDTLENRITNAIKSELEKEFSSHQIDKKMKLLYHPSKIEFSTLPDPNRKNKNNNIIFDLPDLKIISNPVYLRTVHQVRKLLVALLKQNDIDKKTLINIEVARDVNTISVRSAIDIYQKKQEKLRQDAIKDIRDEYKDKTYNPSENEIMKYLLLKEQNFCCLYTGNNIRISDCLGENPTYDIEHTIPKSVFYDNSMTNLTLCSLDFNRTKKQNRLPSELDEATYSGVLSRIDNLGWKKRIEYLKGKISKTKNNPIEKHGLMLELQYLENKYRSFIITKEEIKNRKWKFASYQLPTTRMITSHVKRYLQTYFEKVYTVEGQVTSQLRKEWLGKNIVKPEEKSNRDSVQADISVKKDRMYHFHHTEDAILIALTQRNLYQALTTYWVENDIRFQKNRKIIPFFPWKNFNNDVFTVTSTLFPSIHAPYNYFKQTKRKLKTSAGKVKRDKEGKPLFQKGRGVRVPLHDDSIEKDADKEGNLRIRPHLLTKNTEHPKYYWAKTGKGSNYLGLIYLSEKGSKELKIIKILATLRGQKYENQYIKKEETYQLYQKLHPKQRVIFYRHNRDEIKTLIEENDLSQIQGRIFGVQSFEEDGRILFRKSICTGNKEKRLSKIEWDAPIPNTLRLSSKNWNFICEGKDFKLDITGKLTLLY